MVVHCHEYPDCRLANTTHKIKCEVCGKKFEEIDIHVNELEYDNTEFICTWCMGDDDF